MMVQIVPTTRIQRRVCFGSTRTGMVVSWSAEVIQGRGLSVRWMVTRGGLRSRCRARANRRYAFRRGLPPVCPAREPIFNRMGSESLTCRRTPCLSSSRTLVTLRRSSMCTRERGFRSHTKALASSLLCITKNHDGPRDLPLDERLRPCTKERLTKGSPGQEYHQPL